MLVLDRRLEEKIRIGDDIIITVVQIDKSSVKIGFEAPPDTEIYREELYQKLQEEKKTKKKGEVRKAILDKMTTEERQAGIKDRFKPKK